MHRRLLIIGVALVALIALLSRQGASARPAIFSEGLGLVRALERGRAMDKPVLALATADWCGPCQELKHGALSDPRVETLVRERFVAAYVDVDARKDEAAQMRVIGIPLLIVYAPDGKECRRVEGVVPVEEVLALLNSALGPEGKS